MTRTKNKHNNIDTDLIKDILDQANGQDLFGRDGFFQHLKQSLANGMLEGEILIFNDNISRYALGSLWICSLKQIDIVEVGDSNSLPPTIPTAASSDL
jgi:hypothetical protein